MKTGLHKIVKNFYMCINTSQITCSNPSLSNILIFMQELQKQMKKLSLKAMNPNNVQNKDTVSFSHFWTDVYYLLHVSCFDKI